MAATISDRKRLEFIDVARAAAALIVLFEHAFHVMFPRYKEFSEAHFWMGEVAILVFFMISGFVIPMSLEEGLTIGRFWQRRFFRLFPVYWLSLAAAFLCVVLSVPAMSTVAASDWKSWLAHIFLLQKALHEPPVLGVYWSLHLDVELYIIFSLLAALGLLGRLGVRVFVVLLVLRAVPLSSFTRQTPAVTTYNQAILLAAVFGFMAYRYFAGRLSRRTFYALAAGVLGVVVCRWGLGALFASAPGPVSGLARWAASLGIAMGIFVLLLEAPAHRLPRLGCWVGRRSYPIYLLHPIAGSFVWNQHWAAPAYLCGTIALTFLFAEVAHGWVERPMIAYGRSLERGRAKVEPATDSIELRRAA